jgi:hypothetical protein
MQGSFVSGVVKPGRWFQLTSVRSLLIRAKVNKFASLGLLGPTQTHIACSQRVVALRSPDMSDESAPPACDTRADFSPHIQTEVSVPRSSTQLTRTPQAAPPSTPVVAQSIPMQPAPTLSPVDTAGTTAEDKSDMHAPPMLLKPILCLKQRPLILLQKLQSHQLRIGSTDDFIEPSSSLGTVKQECSSGNVWPICMYQVRSRLAQKEGFICRYSGFSAIGGQPPEPTTLQEALSGSEEPFWTEVIEVEHQALNGMGTWSNAQLPPGRTALPCKWVFRRKLNAD